MSIFGIARGLSISRAVESTRGGERYFNIKTVGCGYGSPFMRSDTRRNDWEDPLTMRNYSRYSRNDRSKLFGQVE